MALTKVSYSMITGAPVNILDFGADPTASSDSSAAIQAAILQTYATGGGAIYCPAGEYRLNTTITFPEDYYITFYGDGSLRTRFVFHGSGNALQASSNTSGKIRVDMSGFYLLKDAANTNATNGIYLKNCQYESNLNDIFVDGFDKAGTQTVEGYTVYYSGVVAALAWGLTWSNVETRRCGNGFTFVNFNSTGTGLSALVNDRHGMYIIDSGATIVGGVFQGNHTATQNDPGDVSLAGEITIVGGSTHLMGVYLEGEGTNPPWSVIVDGIDQYTRSYGSSVVDCQMNRTSNSDHTRGNILVGYAEETIIEGNWLQPTYTDSTAAAAVPHIYLNQNSLNTRIGHNSYQARHWQTGRLYSWLSPIINTTGLPAYTYPFSSSDGGLKTIQKRLRLESYYASPTAGMGATQMLVPGTILSKHSLTRLVWLTNVQATVANDLSAGTFTVKVYNIENGVGSPVLIGTYTSTGTGAWFQLLNQHPYVTLLQPGLVYCTVETNGSFAPTASQAIYVELEFEEFDNH